MRLSLGGVSGAYVPRILTVDEEYGNPYRVWRTLGRQRNPRPEQVEHLREAARPDEECYENLSV